MKYFIVILSYDVTFICPHIKSLAFLFVCLVH